MMKYQKLVLAACLALALSSCSTSRTTEESLQAWYPNNDYYEELDTDSLEVEAQSGSPEARLNLALRLMSGDRTVRDSSRGFIIFEQLAIEGDPRGQFFAGTAYIQGEGAELDEKKSVKWFRKSAENGYDMGQYWYGFMLSRGRGVSEPDWKKALIWFRKAADQGHSSAQFSIGEAYESCRGGLDRDFKKAAYWYRKSDRVQDNMIARYNLRRLIDLGLVGWQEGDPGVRPTTFVSIEDRMFTPCEPGVKDSLPW
jgi:uncharacterized protein